MTLTEFVLVRIAEDEARALAAIQPEELYPWGDRCLPRRRPEDFPDDVLGYLGGTWGEHCAAWSPLRVLAECEAKRRILDEIVLANGAAAHRLFQVWAIPYAAHPDYDENWRP